MKLRVGDPLPDFVLPAIDGVNFLFYEKYCGKPVLLVFPGASSAFSELPELATDHLNVVFMNEPTAQTKVPPDHTVPAPARLKEQLSIPADKCPTAVLLNAHLRIAQIYLNPSPHRLVELVQGFDRAETNSRLISSAAPVLLVDSLIDSELAGRLIKEHQSDNFISGMTRGVGSQKGLATDARIKSRRDHLLTNQSLVNELTTELAQRLIPVITRTFHFKPAHFEGYKVVSYEASERGEFKLHRDNVGEEVRHRRLALSVNLNAGFEGGELVFPEHCFDRYKPEVGGGIVFSGSLLHQVTTVTAGVRYALITFLW